MQETAVLNCGLQLINTMTSRFCDNLGRSMNCRILNVTLKHEATPTAERSTKVNKEECRLLYSTAVSILTHFLRRQSRSSRVQNLQDSQNSACFYSGTSNKNIQLNMTTASLHCTVLPSKWPFERTLDTRKLKIYLNVILYIQLALQENSTPLLQKHRLLFLRKGRCMS